MSIAADQTIDAEEFEFASENSAPETGGRAKSRERAHERDEAVYRLRDILFAAVLLPIVSPLLILIAVLIKLDSRGPVFFIQHRGGRGDREFPCIKFRTLRVLENGDDVRQVVSDDDRVTRVGSVLRRTSLDELPQLINVLRGEMTLVGPRPHALKHDREFEAMVPHYRRRYAVKPGLTGLAQISGLRGEISSLADLEQRVEADLRYIYSRNIWTDTYIIISTPKRMISLRS